MTGAEAQVRGLLADVYTPDGINVWLNSRNTMLDMQRPVDLLKDPASAEDVLFVAKWVAAP